MSDNATCPKCRHYNAMLGAEDGGTSCRDCGYYEMSDEQKAADEAARVADVECAIVQSKAFHVAEREALEADNRREACRAYRADRKPMKALANSIARIGRSNRTTKALVEAMSKLHRTEQQFVTNACLAWLQHLSELGAHQVDARNEASFTVANEIMSAVPRARYGLPLI